MRINKGNLLPIDRAIVERVFEESAPERVVELRAILTEYDPEFFVIPDSPGITPKSAGRTVKFDNKSMRILWLLAHAAWREFCCYCPYVLRLHDEGKPIDFAAMRDDDPGLDNAIQSFESILYLARSAISADAETPISWPTDVPEPGEDRETLPNDQKAIYDLTVMAAAFVFLHEIQHVKFDKDQNAPVADADEETACDLFAKDFLLDAVERYANGKSVYSDLVLMKRAMAISVAISFLYEVSTPEVKAGGGGYPCIADRFENLICKVGLASDSNFWVFSASLLLAKLHRLNGRVDPIEAGAADELCKLLIDLIRASTPDTWC